MPTDTPLLMKLVSPFEDGLRFRSMSASEELGRPFEFAIEAVSEDATLDPYEILGKLVTVELELADESLRYFNGHVTDFGLLGEVGSSSVYHYQLVVRPWLWMLTRSSDCRIFQTKSIPDILKEVFAAYDVAVFDDQLTGTYSPWEYCVQYRETDFNFVSRLMEQEGIYYYFEHDEGAHTLVLVDSPSAHVATPGFESFTYTPSHGSMVDTEAIDHWVFSRGIQPGTFALTDFDFKRPQLNLEGKYLQTRQHTGADGKYFDYPGEYATTDDARRYSRTRLEELQARHETISGSGNVRALAVGSLFKLTDHPRDDQNDTDCLVVSTRIHLQDAAGESGDQATAPSVHCSFAAMPGAAPFRAARLTPKPFVQGPQTAIVVGPSGEEIHTDEHGRVKVHFHWDRLGKKDENDSCWIRVSHPWAGKGWGSVSIPRIGQEVIVDFLEGDPDQPIITGRVYNGESKSAYPLPGAAVISGLKSNTHKGKGYNEMSMDDTAGKEKVTIHAQYDMATTVEHDDSQIIHNDRTIKVDGTHTETVTKDTKITIETGTYNHDVAGNTATYHVSGDLTENFDAKHTQTVGADQSITLKAKRTTDITSDDALTVGGKRDETVTGNRTTDITGNEALTVTGKLSSDATGAASYTSVAKITLTVGGSTIEMVPASITLSMGASSIKIDAMGVTITAPKISLNG
ncbi:type VI secretion system spike protein VgrG1b [soil metagenome]